MFYQAIQSKRSKLFYLMLCGSLSASVYATELHTWTDAEGHRNISTIPPQGFAADGSLRRHYDPNSIQFQHHQMRKALHKQAAEIAASDQLDRNTQATLPADALPTVRAPREGIMGLRKLIELERRSGRYNDEN